MPTSIATAVPVRDRERGKGEHPQGDHGRLDKGEIPVGPYAMSELTDAPK